MLLESAIERLYDLRVGTTPVGSTAALDRELGKVRAGQTIMLLVRRGSATQFVAVTPEEGEKQ